LRRMAQPVSHLPGRCSYRAFRHRRCQKFTVASRQCPAWHLKAPTTWLKSPIVAAPRRYGLSLVAPAPREVRDRAGSALRWAGMGGQRCNTGDIGEPSTIVRISTDGAAARSRAAATNRSRHELRSHAQSISSNAAQQSPSVGNASSGSTPISCCLPTARPRERLDWL
jgi:hypothetical protein